ncbi:hypothetical protein DFH08DRAFT_973994 [Mycena albidolilacea]|uniref:Uncharacterized protein n=1 Tax=Mycena albidolilacea TaxID=1033008 RepID=A0AAD6Z888_9AGAR|nr:hypothetical protein DFH08DRAFT_973994 [Mycena albidolilacea]
MSSSSTAPTTTASPAPTPSPSNHTKLIAGIIPSVATLVGAFIGCRKWGAKLRCRRAGVQISVDVSPSTDNQEASKDDQDASTDVQDVPTTPGHRRGPRRGHRRGPRHSESSSRALVVKDELER